MAPQGRQLQPRAPGTANLQIGRPLVLGPRVESQLLATPVIPKSRRRSVERGIPRRVPRPPRSQSESAAHQKKCHSVQPFSHRIPLKTDDPCTKEVSQKMDRPCQPAIRQSQIKWDSVSLNFGSNSLKTNKSHIKQVGHFFDDRIRTIIPSEHRAPRDLASLAARHSSLAAGHFYSTMKMNRNRYNSMKTNARCTFYSTIILGGSRNQIAPPAATSQAVY
jgi:hypothetical protein